jgi:hypothetical protein
LLRRGWIDAQIKHPTVDVAQENKGSKITTPRDPKCDSQPLTGSALLHRVPKITPVQQR